MLTIDLITTYDKFEAIKETWNGVLEKSKIHVPYLTHDWFKTCWKCLDNDKELHIILVKDEGEIIGIAPLLLSPKRFLGFQFNKLCFIKNSYTPFQDLILTEKKEECLALMLKYLNQISQKWNLIELDEMRADSDGLKLLKKYCSHNGLLFHEDFKSESWYLPIEKTWEDGLKKLKSKTRKEFKRKVNRMERLGKLHLEIITDIQEINTHLKTFFSLYEKTWKGKEPNPEFYYRIAEVFSHDKNLLLYTLFLDNDPVAYLYAIKLGHVLYGIKTTYDPSYYAFSPGIALFYKAIETVHNSNDIEEFDIGRGKEQFKREWTSLSHRQLTIYLGKRRFVSFFYFFCKFNFLAFCRAHPAVNHLVSAAKSIIHFFINIITKMIHEGPLRYIKRILSTIKWFIYNKSTIEIFKVPIFSTQESQGELESSIYKFADMDDQLQIAVAMQSKNLKLISKRFDNKDKCLVVLRDNKIIHYFWFTFNETYLSEINKSVKLEHRQAFLYDHSPVGDSDILYLFRSITKRLAEEDIREILTAIRLDYVEEREAFISVGFKKYRTFTKRRVFKKPFKGDAV